MTRIPLPAGPGQESPPPRTRSDARHNRTHLLAVARATFAAEGLEVTMREIARRSGLGVATLYRHFPRREELIVGAFAEQVRECVATVTRAADDPDAWRGLSTVVAEVSTRQALDRGFNAALLGSATALEVFATERAQNVRVLTGLVERARREGAVRADLTVEDFWLVLSATAGPGLPTGGGRRALVEAHRLAAILLQGMRPPSTRKALPLPARDS